MQGLKSELDRRPNVDTPLSIRAKNLAPPGTSSMRSKANALKEKGIHIINFAAGELSCDACPDMKTGASEAIAHGFNRYTPPIGLPKLREKLAEQVSLRCGVPFNENEIAVTAGAKQALFNASMVLLDPEDEVIIPTPYWETFPTQIQLSGANPVFLNTRKNQFQLTCDSVESLVTRKTKMIIINTPNNPTGVVYKKEELWKIAGLAYENDIWILFDECYRELTRAPNEHHNIVSLFEPIKRQTILIDSFSKSRATTGWRIGYACAPKEIISAMNNLQGHTTSNPSSLSQYAALSAINNQSRSFVIEVNCFLEKQSQIAFSLLEKIPFIRYSLPQGTFYIYIDISEIIGKSFQGDVISNVDNLCEILLEEAHVAVVPGSSFGDPSSIRLSYATSENELQQGLSNLGHFISKIKNT